MFTPAQIAQFRKAIKDTTDLFFGLNATYHLYGESTDTFEEDNTQRQVTNYTVPCLKVYEDTEDGQVEIKKEGLYDMSEGYILFNFQDCETVGLIDVNGRFIGNPNLDEVTVMAIKFQIIGINLLGQWVDKNSLVKIQVRKQIR